MPVNSGSLRDISGCFTSSRKKNCAAKKATQLRNSRVDKAKRKLVLDSEDKNPQELKKVTRISLQTKTVNEDFPLGNRIVDFEVISKGLEKCTNCLQDNIKSGHTFAL
ncbi:hypothetical protein OS493_019337 [Desmophyllum pertusum]|uniref:Uncharacterized protein n=1 Tax=Desmophyllum pertusum TaxID=174260 RepID=A0A9X0A0H0_9CNID|nr:hypothetical protein OS493_019337 [Desmophyllum pertusum]